MDIKIFEMPFLWICVGYMWGTLMTGYFTEKWFKNVITRMIDEVSYFTSEGIICKK